MRSRPRVLYRIRVNLLIMDLFNKLLKMLNSQNDGSVKSDEESSQDRIGVSFEMTPPEDSIDPDYLQDVIAEFYDASKSNAEVIAGCIEEGYFEGYGYDKITRNVKEEGVELERDEIRTIIWTELGGVQTRQNITDAHEQATKRDFVNGVEWSVPNDERGCSPVCEATTEEIDARGGSVSVAELQQILRAKAEKYEDGTPERMDDWIPHKKCRCTVMKALG